MQGFSVEAQKSLGLVYRESEQNFTARLWPEIWVNFSKVSITVIANLKNYSLKKMFEKFICGEKFSFHVQGRKNKSFL